MDNNNKLLAVLLMFLSSFLLIRSSTAAYNYNVVNFGAKPDGRTDSTKAFLGAWQAACRSAASVTITVPRGSFLLKPVEFRGPCRSRITFQIYGTIVAPSDYRGLGNSGYWILFVKVNRISINGGTLDARGASFWACRKSGKSCPAGARSMTFNWANDVVVTGLTSINSQVTHLVINSCNNVVIRKVKLVAPDQSPNTDGLHVQASAGVTVTDSTFQTGDDCGSGVKITQVVYRNIQGSSRTQQALTFDCSRSNPCQAIRLHDIKLTFNGRSATSTCKNIKGVKAGVVMPQGCL
ncbi:PREDICTED: polygalacturonase-like [Camelina sativa]|uniref:Polygalacturonase-like n=1 Tax=Camelina sativa TaxID=90675 RepID=A0ABM0SLL2_CAMSA|nr:PREDICTED: polygalacturonase-like [Camelina sativa]